MKYFNRKSFAVEQLFSDYLHYGGITESDMIKSEIPAGSQNTSPTGLFQLLRDIASDKYDMSNFIPENILSIASGTQKTNAVSTAAQILKWINECRNQNIENAKAWKSDMDDLVTKFRWDRTGYFKNPEPAVFPLKVHMEKSEGRKLKITLSAFSWGEFVFEFNEFQPSDLETAVAEAWLLWAEIEHFQNEYEFRLLLNTKSIGLLTIERLMKDEDWIELKIRCSPPELKIRCFDYAFRLYETGCQSTRIFLQCCKILLDKERDLGTLYFNEKERELLPLAHLYACISPVLNMKSSKDDPMDIYGLEEFISNRFGFEQACRLIKDAGDSEFLEVLNSLRKALEDSEIDECYDQCSKIWGLLVDRDRCGSGRILYHNLSSMMLDAAAEYEKEWGGRRKFLLIRYLITSIIEPHLLRIGFKGEFPHYRRLEKNKGQYVTFTVEYYPSEDAERNDESDEYRFIISIIIGRARGVSKLDGNCYLSGLPFESTNTWDCTWEKMKCRLTSIGPSKDDGRFVLRMDSTDETENGSGVKDQVSSMLPYIEVLSCIFQNKKLPQFYLKHHSELLKSRSISKRMIWAVGFCGLLFGLIMWLAFNIVLPVLENGTLPENIFKLDEFLLCIGLGAFWGTVFGAFVFYDMKRKVWPL